MNKEVEEFLDLTAKPNPAQGEVELSPGATGGDDITETFEEILDLLSFISIPLAVAAVVLVGILIISNIVGANPGGATQNLRKIAYVLIGLIIVFNSHTIVATFV